MLDFHGGYTGSHDVLQLSWQWLFVKHHFVDLGFEDGIPQTPRVSSHFFTKIAVFVWLRAQFLDKHIGKEKPSHFMPFRRDGLFWSWHSVGLALQFWQHLQCKTAGVCFVACCMFDLTAASILLHTWFHWKCMFLTHFILPASLCLMMQKKGQRCITLTTV